MMSRHQVSWYDEEKTIVVVKAAPYWTWKEAMEVLDAVYQLQETVNHGVYVIYDLRESGLIPHGSIANIKQLLTVKEHTNDRLVFFVSNNRLFQMMLDAAQKVYKARKVPLVYYFIKDINEAFPLINTDKEAARR